MVPLRHATDKRYQCQLQMSRKSSIGRGTFPTASSVRAHVSRVQPEQATEVRLVMEGVACAAVALAAAGQPEGVRVALLSPEEAPTSDAWQCSAHQVFRCLPVSFCPAHRSQGWISIWCCSCG